MLEGPASNPNVEVELNEIDLEECIGRGGHGAVYKVGLVPQSCQWLHRGMRGYWSLIGAQIHLHDLPTQLFFLILALSRRYQHCLRLFDSVWLSHCRDPFRHSKKQISSKVKPRGLRCVYLEPWTGARLIGATGV